MIIKFYKYTTTIQTHKILTLYHTIKLESDRLHHTKQSISLTYMLEMLGDQFCRLME